MKYRENRTPLREVKAFRRGFCVGGGLGFFVTGQMALCALRHPDPPSHSLRKWAAHTARRVITSFPTLSCRIPAITRSVNMGVCAGAI